jgi:hypothetical protein
VKVLPVSGRKTRSSSELGPHDLSMEGAFWLVWRPSGLARACRTARSREAALEAPSAHRPRASPATDSNTEQMRSVLSSGSSNCSISRGPTGTTGSSTD